MPFLVVLAIGMVDFGQAWNLKHILSNAAREGARFGASQSTADLNPYNPNYTQPPPSVTAISNVVAGYLSSAGLTQCTVASSGTQTSTLVWTYSSSSSDPSCANFSLVIDRGYSGIAVAGTTVVATHVIVTYPYTWTFNHVIGLLVSGANASPPSTISSDAVMQNVP